MEYSWNNFSVLPELFRYPLRNVSVVVRNFSGDFLSDSPSSIQQIDDP